MVTHAESCHLTAWEIRTFLFFATDLCNELHGLALALAEVGNFLTLTAQALQIWIERLSVLLLKLAYLGGVLKTVGPLLGSFIFSPVCLIPHFGTLELQVSLQFASLQVYELGHSRVQDQVIKGSATLCRSENQQEEAEVSSYQTHLNRDGQDQEKS